GWIKILVASCAITLPPHCAIGVAGPVGLHSARSAYYEVPHTGGPARLSSAPVSVSHRQLRSGAAAMLEKPHHRRGFTPVRSRVCAVVRSDALIAGSRRPQWSNGKARSQSHAK